MRVEQLADGRSRRSRRKRDVGRKKKNPLPAVWGSQRADLGRAGQLQHKGQWVPLGHWPVDAHHLHLRTLAAHRQAQEQVENEEPQRGGLPVLRLLVEDQISGTTPEPFRRLFCAQVERHP